MQPATDETDTGSWRDWLAKYGVFEDESHPNVSSGTAYSCAGQYYDIHRHYFSVLMTSNSCEPLSKDDPDSGVESYMPSSTIPLPQPVVLGATTPDGGLNRYLYKYAAHQKRHWDSLLADSRNGFIPLVPEALGGQLPSRSKDACKNGMDIRLDATFGQEAAALEPIEFGNFLSFMEDTQLVSFKCRAKDANGNSVDREINVALCAVDSTPAQVNGKTLYETEYQLVLFDAVEGGIEIAPASRELSTASNADNILTATVTVNFGAVVEFTESNVLDGGFPDNHQSEIESGRQVFVVDLPRYYHDIISMKARRLP